MVETREIAPDVRHFVFAVDGVDQFAFAPGQFVSFTEQLGTRPITRAYSIASVPDGNRFELCLNLVKDGRFSPHLFQLRPGDRVPMKGPVGTFTLRNPGKDALFVATGTGIAPMRGLAPQAIESGPDARVTLLFGVRHEHGILYRDHFEAMAAEHPNFGFVPTLTRPSASWTGLSGRVQQHLDALLDGRTNIDVYICGLKEMVNSVRDHLNERGFDRRQIITEKYD